MRKSKKMNIAIVGLGNIGLHLYKYLQKNKKILKTMSGNCQSILTLIGEEYKYKEISERLNMPIGTVMSNLLRCRKKLNQKLLSCISTVFGGILTNKTSGARERSESERAFICARTRASSPAFPLRETALF